MKKRLCKYLLSLFITGSSYSVAAAQQVWDGVAVDTEWEGEGTPESPYLIGTPAELAGLAKRTNADETFEGKHFRLTADMSLSDPTLADDKRPLWTPIGNYTIANDDSESNPGGFYAEEHWFKGTFDGNGHTISNLWYNGTTDFDDWNDPFGSGQLDFSAWNKALFGCMDGATITNLNLKDANVCGTSYIGGLVIMAKNSTFTDVHVGGTFISGPLTAGGSAAGLAVMAYDCNFTNCSADVRVCAKSNSGALVGHLYGASTVTDCTTSGEVKGGVYIAGFIGSATADQNSTSGATPVITRCSSAADVNVIRTRNQGDYGAGFIGFNTGTISRCSATGNIHLQSDIGSGFVADNRGTIESCYATGDVYSEESGYTLSAFVNDNGFDAGYSEYYPGTILNCYATGQLRAPEAPGDVIASPTHISGFVWINFQEAGSRLANCYYDADKNPELYAGMSPECGSYGVTTEYMKSKEFVECLNNMAAVMGTHAWEYNPDGYPQPTDNLATEIAPFFGGGNGTEQSPFLISDKQQLENLAFAANRNWNFTGQYIKQTADIALNAPQEEWSETMPTQWTPIAMAVNITERRTYRFCGNYDGDFHTVSNMYIDDKEEPYPGLFGILGKGAVIRNLGVIDAWMSSSYDVGIIAGAVRIHNDCDQFMGDVKFENCWTSGVIEKGEGGAIVGCINYGGNTYLTACGSTADINGHGLVGDCGAAYDEFFINGCWYAGKSSLDPVVNPTAWKNSYIDSDLNKSYKDNAAMGRSTGYMKSKQFINDLNYAATVAGVTGDWRYNQGEYPLFTGQAPAVPVTVNDNYTDAITFKAFKGTLISKPAAPVRPEYEFVAWCSDKDLRDLFNFAETPVENATNLYAAWRTPLAADYTIFKNKFAKTFTITTPNQLLAFANIVNGKTTETDQSDFEGKTVTLGNDIELNDISNFEEWGVLVSPQAFPSISTGGTSQFKGIFDGKGYSIKGLYQESDYYASADFTYPSYGFFCEVPASAKVSDLILDHAFINARKGTSSALLVTRLDGTLERCAAIGRIDATDAEAAGLVHTVNTGATISECYADVDLNLIQNNNLPTGVGLVYNQSGTMSDCFAVGNVTIAGKGNYAGIAYQATKGFDRCYAAVKLDWTPENLFGPNVGAAFYSWHNSADASSHGYYDADLFDNAFTDKESMDNFESFAANAKGRGIGLAADAMKRMTSFPDWNFTNVWGRRNDTNNGYPYLRWMNPDKANDPDMSGIGSVEESDCVEIIDWYNLDGIRIENPTAPGIYIVRRSDGTVSKVIR